MPRRRPTDDERTYDRRRLYRINNWRRVGLILPSDYTDWKDFYDRGYLSAKTCDGPGTDERCDVVFGDPGPTGETGGRNMEHCHTTNKFRGVCCTSCNMIRRRTLDGRELQTEEEKLERGRAKSRAYRAANPRTRAQKDARNAMLRAERVANPLTRAQMDAVNAKVRARRAAGEIPPLTRAQRDVRNARKRAKRAAKKAAQAEASDSASLSEVSVSVSDSEGL